MSTEGDPPVAQGDNLLRGLAAGILAVIRDPDVRDPTFRQIGILLRLCTTSQPHTVRGLAAYLRVSKPAIVRALDALSDAGLVRRKPDPADGRSVLVEPTRNGRALVRRIAASAAAAVAEPLAGGKDRAPG